MACSFNAKDNTNVIFDRNQRNQTNILDDHQRNRANFTNMNMMDSSNAPPGIEAQQSVEDHFNKSMDNITVSGRHVGKSWQDKNLPVSFYSKPAKNAPSVGHSRDGSTDSSGLSSGCSGSTQSPHSILGTVAHSRTQSAPTNLTSHQLSFPQQKGSNKQRNSKAFRSVDIDSIDVDDQPLPLGWERSVNEQGQPYFINHTEKITSWVDPRLDSRKPLSTSASHLPPMVDNANSVDMSLGPLPQGWEEAYTQDGHRYFINHNCQATTWYDPRLPEDVQHPTVLQRHATLNQQQTNPMQMNLGAPTMRLPPQNLFQNAPSHSHQLSGGSATGVPASHLMAPISNPRTGNAVAAGGGTYSPNSQKRVQDLSRERQNLRMRQEEILKQGLLTDRISPASNPMSPTHNIGVENCHSIGHYPSQAPSSSSMMQQTGDYHFRQESSDSGLGMPPFGYSHPHTPENFLSSEFPTLNIAGIDLNIGVSAMEMDTMEEIPQISQRDLDQVFNCRPSIRP